MTARYRTALAASAAAAALVAAGAARAGGCTSCTPAPTSCNCTVPNTHQVTVPGVGISPPSVYVNAPSIVVTLPNVEVQTGAVAVAGAASSASATAGATSSASGSSSASGYASALANAQANALGAVYNGGGGSGWSASEGASGYIPSLSVEGVEGGEARRVCTEMRATAAMTAVQAQCLDDKDVPHPASQVSPERDVASAYEGEVYRCIAGTRMQYTLADFNGKVSFDHGQTVTCAKGEALYHGAAGGLACRPQKPARDCNERSLLRRFGAGVKVVKLDRAQQCVAYRSVTAKAAGDMSMVLDGGVGGVVR